MCKVTRQKTNIQNSMLSCTLAANNEDVQQKKMLRVWLKAEVCVCGETKS